MTAPTFTFTKATKKESKARIALEGISGSGKTYTALTIASALGQRIAVIDTEHRSASKYAGIFDFDTLPLDSYDPRILIAALAAAGDAGYEVAIVDSMSHFWMGTGGMLEAVDSAAKRAGGHGMSGWKEMRPVERQMIEALLAYPGHVIVTMRVKNDWVEQEVRGRKAMVKVGTKAEQREGLEYEFDIVGSLSGDNELIISKSRCPQLSGVVVSKPGLDLGHTIREWLEDGEAGAPTVADYRARALAAGGSVDVLRPLLAEIRAAGLVAAPVLNLAGAAVSLGDLIVELGRPVAAPSAPSAPEQHAEPVPAAEPRPVSGPPRQYAVGEFPAPDALGAAATGLLDDIAQAHDETAMRRAWKAAGEATSEQRISLAESDYVRDRWAVRKEQLFPSKPAVEAQHKRIHAMCKEAGFDDRDTRLTFLSQVTGRDIDTQNRLNVDEASAVIERLKVVVERNNPPAEQEGQAA